MRKGPYDVLDLKALRCFFSVAKHGSLTRAGIELGISEAAVSQRVRALEAGLGIKLYEARGGRVKLTPAGERALSFSASVFDEIEEFEHTLTQSEETGEIVLAAHDSILGYLLPDAVQAFSQAHPLARLKLLAQSYPDTVRMVAGNEADLGVVPKRELPRDLSFQPVATFSACLLTPKGHPLARRARADFRAILDEETIRRHPLIVADTQLEAGMLSDAFARLKLPLNVGMTAGSFETVKRYVERGLGIAVVTGLCITPEDRRRIEVIDCPKDIGADSTYGVVLRRGKHRGVLLTDLLNLITGGARTGRG